MGYDDKATIAKAKALIGKKGKFSIKQFAEHARSSASYKEMKTMGGVNKQSCMYNICRELNEHMVQPMVEDITGMYASLIHNMSQEIKRLNNELSGTEETAPKNEAEERYLGDLENLHQHAEKVGRLEKQKLKCEKMASTQNDKIFGSSMDSDDDDEVVKDFDSKELEVLKTLKEHGKSIDMQIDNAKHSLYTQASNGLYNKSIKAANMDKATFPRGISQMKKKEFIAKVKQYIEYRPEQYSFVLPEARRSMDDLNRRTGVHYNPGTWDEQDEGVRNDFKQQRST
jgi:hypothetical protein